MGGEKRDLGVDILPWVGSAPWDKGPALEVDGERRGKVGFGRQGTSPARVNSASAWCLPHFPNPRLCLPYQPPVLTVGPGMFSEGYQRSCFPSQGLLSLPISQQLFTRARPRLSLGLENKTAVTWKTDPPLFLSLFFAGIAKKK